MKEDQRDQPSSEPVMSFAFWKKISGYLIGGGSVIAVVVGFVASLETLRPRIESWWDTARELRLRGADCRSEGYILLRAGASQHAQKSFKCAAAYFHEAAKKGDALGWYGLALIYGDDELSEVLPQTKTDDEFLIYADVMWCKARRAGLSAADHIPPHRSEDPC